MAQAAMESTQASPLRGEELSKIDAYWRVANYVSVVQICLMANPLLREPLKLEHIKPRLLGTGEGSDPPAVHQQMAATLDQIVEVIRAIQNDA